MKKGGGKNVSIKKSNPNFETAEFQLGYIYRDIETQLNHFGATNGGEITVTDAARWVGTLLLAKAGGSVLDGPEHLSDVRGGSAKRHEVSVAAPVHVRTRHRKAPVKPFEDDSAIGRAFELAQRGVSLRKLKREVGAAGWVKEFLRKKVRTLGSEWKLEEKNGYIKITGPKKKKRKLSRKARKAISDAQKARWAKVKKPKLKGSGIKGWWARMTPEQRKTEMLRRTIKRDENRKAA